MLSKIATTVIVALEVMLTLNLTLVQASGYDVPLTNPLYGGEPSTQPIVRGWLNSGYWVVRQDYYHKKHWYQKKAWRDPIQYYVRPNFEGTRILWAHDMKEIRNGSKAMGKASIKIFESSAEDLISAISVSPVAPNGLGSKLIFKDGKFLRRWEFLDLDKNGRLVPSPAQRSLFLRQFCVERDPIKIKELTDERRYELWKHSNDLIAKKRSKDKSAKCETKPGAYEEHEKLRSQDLVPTECSKCTKDDCTICNCRRLKFATSHAPEKAAYYSFREVADPDCEFCLCVRDEGIGEAKRRVGKQCEHWPDWDKYELDQASRSKQPVRKMNEKLTKYVSRKQPARNLQFSRSEYVDRNCPTCNALVNSCYEFELSAYLMCKHWNRFYAALTSLKPEMPKRLLQQYPPSTIEQIEAEPTVGPFWLSDQRIAD